MSRIVIFGGYGTFGGHVARELARFKLPLTIAGRDGERATEFAASLGSSHRSIAADVRNPTDCRAALAGATVAVHCAGPFRAEDTAVLEACLDAGCHYADIADDRAYVANVRHYGNRFAVKGLVAVYGCSSLPGISGALALSATAVTAVPSQRARVTLFIGNNNPKGRAAMASLLAGLGRPIRAPQVVLRGFRDREIVPLPAPFGARSVFNFESPDYDLLPGLVGVNSVTVKVGFELRLANYAFAALARLPFHYGGKTARLLAVSARLFGGTGSSGGAVMVELFGADGSVRRAAMVARRDGQRMAALPCAYAVRAIVEGAAVVGAKTVYELFGADLVRRLVADGFEHLVW